MNPFTLGMPVLGLVLLALGAQMLVRGASIPAAVSVNRRLV